ncbi:hypothetical protein N9B82_04675 [Saprospiraceae bacterium]|nr:hypothetical protein [Saprospiraceae bacterium]
MKIFVILLFACTCFIGNSQLYITEYTGEVLFGPENVAPTNVEICNQMIGELEYYQQLSIEMEDELASLEVKKKLSAKERRRKKKLKANVRFINNDLDAAIILMKAWEDHRVLLSSMNDAKCYLLDRDGKEFTKENALFTSASTEDPRQYLDLIVNKLQATKWVKKKADKNCRSANPEDCLVWCLVNTEKVVYDLYGNLIELYLLEDLGLDFNPKINRYYGKSLDSKSNQNYALISNETGQIISMSGLLILDCTD